MSVSVCKDVVDDSSSITSLSSPSEDTLPDTSRSLIYPLRTFFPIVNLLDLLPGSATSDMPGRTLLYRPTLLDAVLDSSWIKFLDVPSTDGFPCDFLTANWFYLRNGFFSRFSNFSFFSRR